MSPLFKHPKYLWGFYSLFNGVRLPYAELPSSASVPRRFADDERSSYNWTRGRRAELAIGTYLSDAAGFKVNHNDEERTLEYSWDLEIFIPSWSTDPKRVRIEVKLMPGARKGEIVFSRDISKETLFMKWKDVDMVLMANVEDSQRLHVWAALAPELFSLHCRDAWTRNEHNNGSNMIISNLSPYYREGAVLIG